MRLFFSESLTRRKDLFSRLDLWYFSHNFESTTRVPDKNGNCNISYHMIRYIRYLFRINVIFSEVELVYFPMYKLLSKTNLCCYWRVCACKAVGPPWNQRVRSPSLIFPLRLHPSATPFGLPTYRGSIFLDIRQAMLFISMPCTSCSWCKIRVNNFYSS